MRLNLGCGRDIKDGYVNVDLHVDDTRVVRVDLSQLPWPFEDNSADEILMLDFLEHFEYRKTKLIINEVWRVLKPDAFVDIQVPDFAECSRAMLWHDMVYEYYCNRCGHKFETKDDYRANFFMCPQCNQSRDEIAQAAMQRLYGGQDRPGNWHYTAFTKMSLKTVLEQNGFHKFMFEELNENGETYAQNWNFKIRAHKKTNLW